MFQSNNPIDRSCDEYLEHTQVTRNLANEYISVIGVCTGNDTSAIDSINAPRELREKGDIINCLEKLGFGKVTDCGDFHEDTSLLQTKAESNPARQSQMLADISKRVVEQAVPVLEKGEKVLFLGGDHSSAFASLNSFASFCARQKLKGGVIHIDAHGDVNTLKAENNYAPLPGESGTMHGMSIGSVVGSVNPEIDSIIGMGEKLKANNILSIGLNATDKAERERIKKEGFQFVTKTEILDKGLQYAADKIRRLRQDVDVVMVTFDVDSSNEPGTEMENEFGISRDGLLRLAIEIATEIPEEGLAPAVAFEIAEYSPIKDNEDYSTAEMIKQFIAACNGITLQSYLKYMKREVSKTNDLSDVSFGQETDRLGLLIERVVGNRELANLRVRKERRAWVQSTFSKIAYYGAIATTLLVGTLNLAKKSDDIQIAEKSVAAKSLDLSEVSNQVGKEMNFAYTGVDRTNYGSEVGFTTSPFTEGWYLEHDEKESFDKLESLFLKTMKTTLDEYYQAQKAAIYSGPIEGSYMNKAAQSRAFSVLRLALDRAKSSGDKRKLLENSLATLIPAETEREVFIDNFSRFDLDVSSNKGLYDMLIKTGLL